MRTSSVLTPITPLPIGLSKPRVLFVLGFTLFAMLATLHYYHSASETREASIILGELAHITTAAANLDKATLSTSTIAELLPADELISPWGSNVSVEEVDEGSYTLAIPLTPAHVCKLIKKEIKNNPHVLADATTCPHSGSVTFLYTVA